MENSNLKARFIMILACDTYGTVGDGTKMPWKRLHGDLDRFRKLTTGHAVVMGRNTFESLPSFPKGLKDRTNYILSTKYDPTHLADKPIPNAALSVESDTVKVFSETDVLVDTLLKDVASGVINSDIFIIGGVAIWRAFRKYLDEVHISLVHKPQRGSVFYPEAVAILQEAVEFDVNFTEGWCLMASEEVGAKPMTTAAPGTVVEYTEAYTYYRLRYFSNKQS